jgi:hypothetical protein
VSNSTNSALAWWIFMELYVVTYSTNLLAISIIIKICKPEVLVLVCTYIKFPFLFIGFGQQSRI